MAFNGATYVAVGAGLNRVAYSSDGVTWIGSSSGNTVFSDAGNNMSSVTWNGTYFIAGASATNKVAYSSDGITWTASSSGNSVFSTAAQGFASRRALPYVGVNAGNVASIQPAFSAYATNTSQLITSGSQQKVLFQVEEYDTNNNYANSRFTPTVAGYYQLNAEVRLDGTTGTGECMIVIWKNGAEYKRGWNSSGTTFASSFFAMSVSTLVYANGTTDYFEVYVQQGSGGTISVTAVNSANITWFNGCLLARA
jgi:hypothetical protein